MTVVARRAGSRPAAGRPTVSIVTPTLNQAPFLQRTLDSVRAQSYPVSEHIVVDGGSTDGTLDILRRQRDGGSVRWTSEPDGGMYEAVNKGLEMASGEILGYLASDDAYLPWAIETVVETFAAQPAVELAFGDGVTIEEGSGTQILRLYAPFDRISLANHASLMQPAVFWRRSLYERFGGFDVRLRYVADLDYWLRAAAAGARIAHVDELLAVERVHEDRLSIARREAMKAEEQEMRERHAGPAFGGLARQRAVRRYARWERWLWLRFLLASRLHPLPGPWHRFLSDGRVSVHYRRALTGLRHGRHHLLRGAIDSRVAADVLAA